MLRWLGSISLIVLPSSTMRPPVGNSKPAIMRSVVVLPQPLGPSSVTNSPFSTDSETLSTATTLPLPSRAGKRFSSASRIRKLMERVSLLMAVR